MERYEEKLDRWIDAALKNGANTEPLAGYEERLLQRVNQSLADAPRRRTLGWPWLALAATAAAIALIVAISLTRPHRAEPSKVVNVPHAPAQLSSAQPTPEPLPQFVKQPTARPHAPRVLRASARPTEAPVPKLATFPAPSPLTAEEEQILRLARRSQAVAYMRLRTQDEIEAEAAINEAESSQQIGSTRSNSGRDSRR